MKNGICVFNPCKAGQLRTGGGLTLDGSRQDKDRGVIPENQLQKVDPNAMAYSFAVKLGFRAAANADLQIC